MLLGILTASLVLLMMGSIVAGVATGPLTMSTASSNGAAGTQVTTPSREGGLIDVELELIFGVRPSRQITVDGSATYKIYFKDTHEACTDQVCPTVYPGFRYNYELSFEAEDGTTGVFDEDEFTIGAGKNFTTILSVNTKNKGANNFVVHIKGVDHDYKAKTSAVIIYFPGTPIQDTSFFVGKGFILDEDETQGHLVDLTILRKDNTLSGKATIGQRTYRIDGEVYHGTRTEQIDCESYRHSTCPEECERKCVPSVCSDNMCTADCEGEGSCYSAGGGETVRISDTLVRFDLIYLGISERPEMVVGSFEGYVKQLSNFKLLKGDLEDFNGKDWSLTAFGKERYMITPADSAGGSGVRGGPATVRIDDVLVVEEEIATESGATSVTTGVSEEFYIRPVEVYRKKIFGLFPWGARAVKIEIIKEDSVMEEEISENSDETIGGHTVSVGSLADEDNIEINVN